jgi:Pyridoxamine 5'-phosphate oxidase
MSDWRGTKFGALSKQELDEFLAGPWLARVACLKPNGWPYVVPVWYHWDGAAFWIVGRAKSEWCQYMADDPRVSLVVDEPTAPIRKVICEGRAEIIECKVGPFLANGEKSIWNQIGETHTGPRYLGEKAQEYRGSVNVEPCWTIKIVPVTLTTWQGFGWHARYKHPELHDQ